MNEVDIAKDVVKKFEYKHGKGESRGACYTIASMIWLLLPRSRLVRGYIRMIQGDAQHWWVVLEDGTIIDPLADMYMDKPFEHIKVGENEREG